MNNKEMLLDYINLTIAKDNKTQTEESIRNLAQKIRRIMQNDYPVADSEFEWIIKKIQSMHPVKMDIGVYIEDRQDNYAPWYHQRLSEIEQPFWQRYRQYLICDKKWSSQVVNSIDLVSKTIVGLLGDPNNPRPFSRKGLVLGDVQSGKTANFTAICNKAVDAGYRIIILLSGLTESLRKQTQSRMDLEFAGFDSINQFHQKTNCSNSGVSKYGKDVQVASFTTTRSDFDAHSLDVNNMSIKAVNSNVPILFVIKKNVSILKNLLNWLSKSQELVSDREHIDFPVLLIDDEADNASINVNSEDSDPTKTNAKIRELLKLFSRVSYLAVTATPFANIFINPDSENEMYENDLFPRDFIYALSPPTSDQDLRDNAAYIGASQIFGDTHIPGMLEEIDDLELVLPHKHKKDFLFSDLPESLKESIVYFCLANAIRDLRGDKTSHRSMLIHISHLTAIHKQIEKVVNSFVLEIQNAILDYSRLPENEAVKNSYIGFIKKVWYKYDFQQKIDKTWSEILPILNSSIAPIEVRVINSRGGNLDYTDNKDTGLRVIAIGGNCLSRGLTLEGLMVSYFRRNTQMYDTLLQMGRWFGFRPGYADLCKIWMPTEIKEWFEQITEAYVELKGEIYEMSELGLTPKDFGLKVRKHPGSLLPTARNKMRSGAQIMKRPINISGRLLETPRLLVDNIKKNEKTIKSFVCKLDRIGRRDDSFPSPFWHEVSSEEISNLLRNFPTDPWNLTFLGRDIAKYIDEHPQRWDVAIMQGDGSEYIFSTESGSLSIKSEVRKVQKDDSQKIYKIMGSKARVASGGSAKIGLSTQQLDLLKSSYNELRIRKPELELGSNIPDDWYFKINRPPLLMIHTIEFKDNPGNFIFAIGTGFPGNKDNEEYVEYVVNLVEWKKHYQEQEDYSDEEEE
ncbi:MAG: Z1 domain-containing protein [Thermoguttaceae bacterium]|nr:Z1 domain-containing protein [Thermoguttaceae bacterium]